MTEAPGPLKPISRGSIPRALEKATLYRLLGEPFFAESICLDVLAVEPEEQAALVTLVLSLTDQFSSGFEGVARAQEAIARMKGEYDRRYYAGIVAERRALAILHRDRAGAKATAFDRLREAMALYEQACALRPDPGNDDAVLRFNSCVRLIEAQGLRGSAPGPVEIPLE